MLTDRSHMLSKSFYVPRGISRSLRLISCFCFTIQFLLTMAEHMRAVSTKPQAQRNVHVLILIQILKTVPAQLRLCSPILKFQGQHLLKGNVLLEFMPSDSTAWTCRSEKADILCRRRQARSLESSFQESSFK